VGASPLPAAVRDGFQTSTGITLVEGCGLTEATCASARTFPNVRRPGSVGQRLPYQRMRAVRVAADGTWEDVPAGETGLLVISGPTVFPGYVTGRTEDGYVLDGLGKLREGWLDTGDLARVDRDGFVYLAGRAKDLIIRGGHNIDPAIVEDALLAHPQVTAASAVGRLDVHASEVLVAYVTLAPGRHGDRVRPAVLGEPAGARPHRRTQDRHSPRRAAPHRRGQALQGRAAHGRHPQGTARRPRHPSRGCTTSKPTSKAARSWPLSTSPPPPTRPPSRQSSAATPSNPGWRSCHECRLGHDPHPYRPRQPLTHERREDTVVPLHRLSRILLGMPNVEDTSAYYTRLGLTPAATDISSIYGAHRGQ
jgi:AMP-binding enzyme